MEPPSGALLGFFNVKFLRARKFWILESLESFLQVLWQLACADVALVADDECEAAGDCSLEALQLRAASKSAGDDAKVPAREAADAGTVSLGCSFVRFHLQ